MHLHLLALYTGISCLVLTHPGELAFLDHSHLPDPNVGERLKWAFLFDCTASFFLFNIIPFKPPNPSFLSREQKT